MSNFDRLNADDRPSPAELSADTHQEGIEAAVRAVLDDAGLPYDHEGPAWHSTRVAIDAYLEALNAH